MEDKIQSDKFLKLKDDVQLFCGDTAAYIYRAGYRSLKLNLLNLTNKRYLESLFKKLKFGLPLQELSRNDHGNKISGIDIKNLFLLLEKEGFFMNMEGQKLIKESDLKRYERQLNWLDVNLRQESAYIIQNKIFDKRICLFGLGSLGNLLLMELAAMGFRNFTIIDKDMVEISNLNRQILYRESNIGKPKVLVAKQWLKSFDKNIEVRAIKKNINSYEILSKTINQCDILILTADEPKSDIVLWTSRYCVSTKTPWVRFSRMGIGPLYTNKSDACAACILPAITGNKKLSKFLEETNLSLNRRKSVVVSEVSFAISIMAHEILLYLTGMSPNHLRNTILTANIDENEYKVKQQKVKKKTNCPCNIYAKQQNQSK